MDLKINDINNVNIKSNTNKKTKYDNNDDIINNKSKPKELLTIKDLIEKMKNKY